MALAPEVILQHYRRRRGLLAIEAKIPIKDEYMLSLVHAPGVARPCLKIRDDPEASFVYTMRGNAVGILTDGSSVLSFGDIGPHAALPVMESEAVLFKALAGVDAIPMCTSVRDPARLARLIQGLTPTFGGFALEDIAAHRTFELMEILEGMNDTDLPVPYFFNDMQGFCSIVLAALLNGLKIVDKNMSEIKAVITGGDGAGITVARFLRKAGLPDITLCDRHGILWKGRRERMNRFKEAAAEELNPSGRRGTASDALEGADLLVGLSAVRTVAPEMIRSMAPGAIVLALATPEPEIDAEAVRQAGAAIVLTGGTDYRHGLDVALAFPGILRGVMDARATRVYDEMLIAAADAIASLVPDSELSPERIIPRVLDLRVGPAVAEAVANAAVALGVAQEDVEPSMVGERTRHLVYEGESHLIERAYRASRRTLGEEAIDLRRRYRGAIEVGSKVPLKDERTLGIIASPGVAQPARAILENPLRIWEYTAKGNLIAVVTDGSSVLRLGGLGPEAALPAVEGKCALFRMLSGVEAIPFCLGAQDVDEFVAFVEALAPALGGVSLDGIAAPQCFEIERRLQQLLDVPVFHDDQHGTAVVVLAAFLNALRVTGRSIEGVKVVVNGSGPAGIAVTRLLLEAGVKDIVVCDRRGALYEGRPGMDEERAAIAALTNLDGLRGDLSKAMRERDVFIGLSWPHLVSPKMIRAMAPRPIVFALASAIPEISPEAARGAGAAVVATGRADQPNHISSTIATPGIFRGALDVAARTINDPMKFAAAHALADVIPEYELSATSILPGVFDSRGAPEVAAEVARAAIATGQARLSVEPRQVLENTQDYLYGGRLLSLPSAPVDEAERRG